MSRHEGVSCDSCMKANFRGRRYKCLVCYDYDLCSTCYEAGATTTRHTVDHAMQCILTRSDYDLYYGGEAVSAEQPQSFVCPYCGKMGYTDATLQEHVSVDHPDSPAEVVCPICAALPGGDPNHVTDDFATHLQLEHRAPRDFEDQMGIRHVRRIPQTALRGRTRRSTNMQFHSTSGGSASLAGLAPSSGREAMDPIAELLSQLSTVRSRAAAAQSVSSQLQQLEQQLHNTRQQLERLPRRAIENSKGSSTQSAGQTTQQQTLMDYAGSVISTAVHVKSNNADSNFLLSKVGDPDLTEIEKQNIEAERADRSIFVQELLLSSMTENLRLSDDSLSNASLSDTDEHSLNFKNNEGNGSIGKELEDEPPSKRPAKQQDQTSEGGGGGGGSGSTTAANRDKSSTSSLPSSAQSLAENVEKSRRERSAVNSNVNSNCVSEGCAGEVTASSTSSSSCLATKEKVLSKGKREGASNGSGLEKGPTKVQH